MGAPYAPSENIRKKVMQARILVVDEDHLQRSVMQSALASGGHDVETASDGMSAVWKIREGHYDLVVLGYKLPEMDGLAVARLIGDIMSEAVRPRLIALTASPDGILTRESSGGKAFDRVIEKWGDPLVLLAPFISSLPLERDPAEQDAAEIASFLTAWDEYETVPDRPLVEGDDVMQARVLVVEDDEIQRAILRAALAAEGYDVEAAADGLSAVREIRSRGYDLALIDYELPEIDGMAVANLIGNLMGQGVRPLLVALTASPDALTKRVGQLDHVFDEIVGKQESLPALLKIIRRHLKRVSNDLQVRQSRDVEPGTAEMNFG
jgi:CheY-like chemotaxis protein